MDAASTPAWAWTVAAACAAVMGFAIQRGGTCLVAAVDEVVARRRATKLAAIGEAALWVAGGLAAVQALHGLAMMPAGYPLTARTVAGGALLGIGATVNGACVFGSVARLGCGEWAYAATPFGFYAGCLSVTAAFAAPTALPPGGGSPVLAAAGWVAAPFAAFALWRVARHGRRHREGREVWSPHAATTVIGIASVVALLLAGRWAYTDVLVDLARGMTGDVAARGVLLAALFAGALWGGRTAGTPGRGAPSARQVARCAVGGALMGWGGWLVPGGNDGLLLVGLPLAQPYAWAALAAMAAAIAAALATEKAFARRAGPTRIAR